MKALVVEDFKLISMIWVKILKDLGYTQVEIAEHSDDVMSKLEALMPELIFMDINLPGKLNGIELTALIKSKYPHIKILILSIHTEPTLIDKAFFVGADGYMTKNSPVNEIKEAIQKIKEGQIYKCKEILDKS